MAISGFPSTASCPRPSPMKIFWLHWSLVSGLLVLCAASDKRAVHTSLQVHSSSFRAKHGSLASHHTVEPRGVAVEPVVNRKQSIPKHYARIDVPRPEDHRILLHLADWAPVYLLLIGLLCSIYFLMSDSPAAHKEERTCFNRLHDWEEGQGKSPGAAHVIDFVHIEAGGGLHKIVAMIPEGKFDWMRVLGALSVLFFALYNLVFIFYVDTKAMVNCAEYIVTHSPRGLEPQYKNLLANAHEATPIITNPRTLLFVVCAECVGLIVVLVQIVGHGVVFLLYLRSPKYHYISFTALWQCSDLIKFLCSYSMLKLLWLVHPKMVTRELNLKLQQHGERHAQHRFGVVIVAVKMLWLISGRVFLLLVLLVSFGVKVAIISTWIHYPDPADGRVFYFGIVSKASLKVWGAIGNFLMQALGAMQLDRVLLTRVFDFVFAGSDAIMEHKEQIMLKVYKARVASVIYHHYYRDSGRPVSFVALMLTLDDVDFQGLLVHENLERKVARMATLDEEIDVDESGTISGTISQQTTPRLDESGTISGMISQTTPRLVASDPPEIILDKSPRA